MKDINIFLLTRISYREATEYENMLAGRTSCHQVRSHEFDTVKCLVDELCDGGATVKDMNGFHFSYDIARIGKEFDLLKIWEGKRVLNIELKSQNVSEEKIKAQLERNKYYLKHIAPELYLFTFVEETKNVYCLRGDVFEKSNIEELIGVTKSFEDYTRGDIDYLFRARNYLISPLHEPELFLSGKYFLTQQQEQVKKDILTDLQKPKEDYIYGIAGSSGTGKTLLLYDIAKDMSKLGKCLVLHCSSINEKYDSLKQLWREVTYLPLEELKLEKLSEYDYILVDESQRMVKQQAKEIMLASKESRKGILFSYDVDMYLTRIESEQQVPKYLSQLDEFCEFRLSDRIRTSPELHSYFQNMMDLMDAPRHYVDYGNVDILYAKNTEETKEILEMYHENYRYQLISYPYDFYTKEIREIVASTLMADQVMGAEFDHVMVVLDKNFGYDKTGKLQLVGREQEDALLYQYSLQAISRAREKLCILVVGNEDVFEKLLHIKYSMVIKETEVTPSVNNS